MGLAKNVISDHFRVKRNTQEIATDFEASPYLSAPARDMFAEVETRLLLEQMFAFLEGKYDRAAPLGKLTAAVKDMIAEGIDSNDYDEITRRTGIPACNVRVYFHRMAKTARTMLEGAV